MRNDLTNGNITKQLLKVAIPVMGSSLFQMAYQIIDMIWVGRINSGSVASVGTAGFFISLSYALGSLSFIGAGIKISHSIGKNNYKKALEFVVAALIIVVTVSLVVTTSTLVFKNELIAFFKIDSKTIISDAVDYLSIVILFSIFKNVAMTFNAVFMGYGSSKTPFIVGSIALVINIILDPIFIFYFDLGVKGAAYATVTAQIISAIILILVFIKNEKKNLHFISRLVRKDRIFTILKLSYPVTIQRVIFSGIYIVLGKIISSWGSDAIAIQKIGVQLESLSWVTAGGMRAGMSAFIGQNFGAKKIDRLEKAYLSGIAIMAGIGLFVSTLFLLFPENIFSLFVKEANVIAGGGIYLRILAISQIFMCIDIMTMGAFDGVGKTSTAPIVSIGYSLLRIPLAIVLSKYLGIPGIWIAISFTTILRGSTLSALFFKYLKSANKILPAS